VAGCWATANQYPAENPQGRFHPLSEASESNPKLALQEILQYSHLALDLAKHAENFED
jgi:hypothetical protein